jgi:hypothetical protein
MRGLSRPAEYHRKTLQLRTAGCPADFYVAVKQEKANSLLNFLN